MGYELVGTELVSRAKAGTLLRIYIDQEAGITLHDCEAVSRQVSGVLDVENPIEENYDLEVSSPGLDRPLFNKEHFDRFADSKVSVRLRTKQAGRRRFEGILKGTQGDEVILVVDGEQIGLPLDQIEKARLVPEF
jgi:ribosome maturation factor RimP